MNNYNFSLLQGDKLVGEGFGLGSNAMEAFESAVIEGYVFLPVNEPVTVLAVNSFGLGFEFKVNRTF